MRILGLAESRKHKLKGQRFHMLTVHEGVKTDKGFRWFCYCDCGKVKLCTSNELLTDHTLSCGCSRYESEKLKTHCRTINIGRKQSEEAIANRSKSMQGKNAGENHYLWRGGTTQLRYEIGQLTIYRKWRKEVLERDGHKCVLCGSTERLQVDHIIGFTDILHSLQLKSASEIEQYPEWFIPDIGRTLCRPCHEQTPNYGNDAVRAKRAREAQGVR